MKKVYKSVESLDKRCYEKYGLNEDLLQEHASIAISEHIKILPNVKNILIVCGSGNNGADGMALARLLDGKYEVTTCIPSEPKSPMGKIQLQRLQKLEIKVCDTLPDKDFDLIVDAMFGSGLNKELNDFYINIIKTLNTKQAVKIACDIPSGIDVKGNPSPVAFRADTTITMGALKLSLLGDLAKDYTGDIKIANLGLGDTKYEESTNFYCLEEKDLNLPIRTKKSSHKGDFGHILVVAGEKIGASVLAGDAGFALGAGLVSVLTHDDRLALPHHIMHTHHIPHNITSIAIGMGLGNFEKDEIKKILTLDVPKVCDADLFHSDIIIDVLEGENIVLTPHPKEFCSLLRLCDIADIDVKTLQENRFFYVELFCRKYPNITLVLKGANTIISHNDKMYINPHGSSILSQGGSGDVLSGFIASYLAQGYDALQSAINGSLALTLSAKTYPYNNYSLKPQDLIEGVRKL
ncbi:MAG: NAD(P)H-hydrate dehydratase [Arcobacteraceae bacterium]